MANEFEISKDIKVEMLLPVAGKGIWNFSKWGGTGVDDWVSSAGAGFAWTDVVATISQATIVQGSAIEQGFYAPAQANELFLQMQSATYDPANNNFIRPGLEIKLSYRPNPDTAPSTYVTLFQGYVEGFNITYDALGNNLIDINASSSLKRALGKNVTSFTVGAYPFNTALDYFDTWETATGIPTGSSLNSNLWSLPIQPGTQTNVLGGELIDELLRMQAGLLWQDPTTNNVQAYGAAYFRTLLGSTPSNQLGGTHSDAATHFCISDLVLSYDVSEAFNTFRCTCTTDSAKTSLRKNQDLVDLYGETVLDVTLNFDASYAATDTVETWTDSMKPRNPGRRVASVQTPAFRRNGTLVNLPALVPAAAVRVTSSRGAYTVDENAVITRATHLIDPSNWFVTLDLWKGF